MTEAPHATGSGHWSTQPLDIRLHHNTRRKAAAFGTGAPTAVQTCRQNGGGVHAPTGMAMEAAYVDAAQHNKACAYGMINRRAASRHATHILLESVAHIGQQRSAQQRTALQQHLPAAARGDGKWWGGGEGRDGGQPAGLNVPRSTGVFMPMTIISAIRKPMVITICRGTISRGVGVG